METVDSVICQPGVQSADALYQHEVQSADRMYQPGIQSADSLDNIRDIGEYMEFTGSKDEGETNSIFNPDVKTTGGLNSLALSYETGFNPKGGIKPMYTGRGLNPLNTALGGLNSLDEVSSGEEYNRISDNEIWDQVGSFIYSFIC